MENASKALLIAAGIFFAMLILTMIMYMSGKITEIGEVQESKRAAEQLAAFNAEYEAYNKKLMYGTDVITVVNKAIENNKKLTENEENSFIDVNLIFIENDENGFTGVKIKDSVRTKVTYGEKTLIGTSFKLRTAGVEMNQDLIEFLNSVSINELREEDGKLVYYYNAISDFKRAIFTCTGFTYNEETGKVNYMEFTQTDIATYW